MDASVIIPTYNRARILEKVLIALLKQNYPSDLFEVIIVDDGSTDDTQNLIRSLDLPQTYTYIKLEKSGVSKARNEGIKVARTDLIIFIDSDLIVIPGFLREHIRLHKEHENIIVRGPVIHTYDIERPFATSKKIIDVSGAYFATGNTSVKKKYLIEAGLFDEGFTRYGWEDFELGVRLKKLGLRLVDNSLAEGYHYQKRFSLDDFENRRERERSRAIGAIIFYNKHPTLEVRWTTQNHPVFFMLEQICSFFSFLIPDKYKIVSFLMKYKKDLAIVLFTNLYFYLLYLRYLKEENQKRLKT